MEFLRFLNKEKRKTKNIFGLFYKQKKNEQNNKKIVELNDIKYTEPITNQFENLPSIENDEIKKIDLKINNKSKNDNTLSELKNNSCLENIENQKPLSKIEINYEQVPIYDNTKVLDNLPLTILKEDTVGLNV